MTLISFDFFAFLLITLLLFYLIKPLQKYVLLAASMYFYFAISKTSVTTWKLAALTLCVFTVTYGGALLIERAKGKAKGVILGFCITALVAMLFAIKYAYNVCTLVLSIVRVSGDFSWMKLAAIIGISYYALSAIGYLTDVSWGNCKAAKNPVDVLLFVFFFPVIVSGPVIRFKDMNEQFNTRRSLSYDNIAMGARRMAWGYFKKLVISERFGAVVMTVYGGYNEYGTLTIVIATLCYAVELYTDFSGCMDIIIGAAMLFGIKLPENFRAPFFSETIQEFWQRWHITLGMWFKDYVMYPLQKSSTVQKIGKFSKKKFGKKFGKKVPFYISMLVLWILIGIWHGGTDYYFVASAGIPCALLILSDVLKPLADRTNKALRINKEREIWKTLRRIRTLLLICICWVVACSGSMANAIGIFVHMFTSITKLVPVSTLSVQCGLDVFDVLVMAIGLLVLLITDMLTQKETSIFEVGDKKPVLKTILIYAEILMIFFAGEVGASSFIYFQF